MKLFPRIILLLLMGCSTETSKNKGQNIDYTIKEYDKGYPKEISELGLEELYSKTKWVLYCIYCDDTVKFQKHTKIKDSITFASLDLRFESVKSVNDTTEIRVSFYWKDSVKCDFEVVENIELASGVGFNKRDGSIIYYTSNTTMSRFWRRGEGSRYEYPLQPEVVSYIERNKEKLSPWFYNEAKLKGILK